VNKKSNVPKQDDTVNRWMGESGKRRLYTTD